MYWSLKMNEPTFQHASFLLYSTLVFVQLLRLTNSCSFSSGDYSVDLSVLSDSEISDDYQGFQYDLTLCRNALDCTGATGTFTGTATQRKADNCNLLGKYDSSSSGRYNPRPKTWTLKFVDGTRYKCNDNISRSIYIQLHCNNSETVKSTSITNTASCVYQWDIETKYVCNTTYNGSLLSDGVSYSMKGLTTSENMHGDPNREFKVGDRINVSYNGRSYECEVTQFISNDGTFWNPNQIKVHYINDPFWFVNHEMLTVSNDRIL